MALIVFRWPNGQRIRHLRSTLYDFLSSLLEELSTNEAIFLGQTPTASEGALLCDFLPHLHGALHTGYSNEVSSSPSSFPSWREARDIPTTRTSGALLHRRCEQINSLDCLGALVSRHHNSRPLRTHRSLPTLHSARQPARYPTAHSITRPFSHSSPDGNILDNGPTCSLLLSPTMIWSNLGDVLPFLRCGLALTSLRASSYSSKTIRTIAR